MQIALNAGRRPGQWAAAVLLGSTLALAATTQSHAFPAKPIRLVVPTSPGGGTDISARIIAPRIADDLGQQVVVENRAGASTMIGGEFVARAAPNGYTLLMGISSLAINPYIHPKVPYDVLRDFAPVTQVIVVPNMLVTHPSLPARSLAELIALVRSRPGDVDFAAGSPGSNPHLAMELFSHTARLRMVHIPYKGQGPALTDVLAGHVPVMMANILGALPHVRSGRLRAHGVTGARRATVAPEVPTIAEAGLPGYEVVQWFGILAPAATPRDIIGRLHGATVRALEDPVVRQRFAADGGEPVGNTPEAFAAVIKSDLQKWGRVIREVNIRWE